MQGMQPHLLAGGSGYARDAAASPGKFIFLGRIREKFLQIWKYLANLSKI